MSSNRLSYDKCYVKQEAKESKQIEDYMLYTGKYNNTAKCRIETGIYGGNVVSNFSGNIVDLDSQLRGQTRPLSKCVQDPKRFDAPLIHERVCDQQIWTPPHQVQSINFGDHSSCVWNK